MVLTTRSANSCFLTEEQAKDLNDAYRDRTQFTAYELTRMGLGDTDGYGDNEDKNLALPINPVDPETEPKEDKINVRKLPDRGG